ncbi:MAG: hypothetical protein EPO58_02765, partial [Chitinophagaceae bacterium]
MKKIMYLSLLLVAGACSQQESTPNATARLNALAEKYVRLGLTIGQYDEAFVDAYYGPDSLRPAGNKASVFPKDSLLNAVQALTEEISTLAKEEKNDTLLARVRWINAQLTAFAGRIRIVANQLPSFDEETKALFGVTVPAYP